VIGRIRQLLLAWIVNTLSIAAAVALVGDVTVTGLAEIVVAGLVFGLVNALVKPMLVLLTLPVHVATLGLSLFLINMGMFALTGWIVDGLDVGGFWEIVKGTLMIWAANVVAYDFIDSVARPRT
jgi:putative membrane protein